MRQILLDGFLGSQLRLDRMRAYLADATGRRTDIWKYDTSGRSGIDTSARQLYLHVAAIGEPVILIGYSMGGLVCRYCCMLDHADRICGLATIHTPHYGTIAARCLPLRAMIQMRPHSDFLIRMENHKLEIPRFAMWCGGDLMVLPGKNARWRGVHRLVECRMPAHVWPIISRTLQRQISDWLGETDFSITRSDSPHESESQWRCG